MATLRIKKHLALTFIASALSYPVSLFAAPPARSSGGESSTQRDLTPDDINQIKQILFDQSIKQYSVNPYGLIQANVNFVDSVRNNTPDFSLSHARLGVLAIENRWRGQLEFEFLGNQPRAFFAGGNDPLYLSQSSNNTVNVRQAQISFDFFRYSTPEKPSKADKQQEAVVQQKNAPQTTTATVVTDAPQSPLDTFISRVSLGGIRVGGANATAPDAAFTPSGYSRQDGIYFTENAVFGNSDSATFGVGVFNNLISFNSGKLGAYQGWGSYPTTSQNFLGVNGFNSSTFQKAYLFSGNYTAQFSDTKFLNPAIYYGFQKRSAVNTNDLGFATTVRDSTHIEGQLLYNDTKLFGQRAILTGNGLSFYMEVEKGSDQHYTTAARDIDQIANLNDGYSNILYGLSLGGDTTAFLTDILTNSDRFLYSGSITYADSRFKHKNYSPNFGVTQYAAAIGYGYKSLEIFLNAAYGTSAKKAYSMYNIQDKSNESDTTHNRTQAYITAALYF